LFTEARAFAPEGMILMSTLLQRTLSLLLRFLLAALAAVFALSLLAAGVVVALFVVLRALLTGRRPALWETWRVVRSRQGRWRPTAAADGAAARTGVRRPAADDVTDVEARDIPRS
jgi:uncharacterized membrane protein